MDLPPRLWWPEPSMAYSVSQSRWEALELSHVPPSQPDLAGAVPSLGNVSLSQGLCQPRPDFCLYVGHWLS